MQRNLNFNANILILSNTLKKNINLYFYKYLFFTTKRTRFASIKPYKQRCRGKIMSVCCQNKRTSMCGTNSEILAVSSAVCAAATNVFR